MRRWWRPVLALAAVVLVVLVARAALYSLYPFPHRAVVSQAARANGLDPIWVAALIRTESGFKPHATSSPGARGLMQLMPATAEQAAAELGIRRYSPERLYEPELNVQLGAHYLADLRRQFHGNLAAALAAYNGGQANVRSWLSDGRWDGTFGDAERIPFAETRRFLQRVAHAHRMYEWLYGG